MRLLSKYCTRRMPPGEDLLGSMVEKPGAGPQYQERLAVPAATGLSVRSQVRWKAGSVKPVWAPAGAAWTTKPSTSPRPASARRPRDAKFTSVPFCYDGVYVGAAVFIYNVVKQLTE